MQQDIKIERADSAGCKGVYVITTANLEKPEHFALDRSITMERNRIAELREFQERMIPVEDVASWGAVDVQITTRTEVMLAQIRELNRICRTTKKVIKNIVPTVGRTLLANQLGNIAPTNVPYIKYAELGSNGAAVSNADVGMGTSVYRNAIASRTNASNIVYATAFFNATETSGTYAEAGIFSDGTASAGTGVLISHVLISVTKTTLQTLTIDWTLTIS